MLTLQSIARPHPEVVCELVEGEAVLIVPERAQTFVLNAVGAQVWQLLDGERSLSLIADDLCAAFDVSRSQASSDLLELIEQFVARDLVTL